MPHTYRIVFNLKPYIYNYMITLIYCTSTRKEYNYMITLIYYTSTFLLVAFDGTIDSSNHHLDIVSWKKKQALELLFLYWNHIETNRTPNLLNTIAPCQSSKHEASITVFEGGKIYPKRHLFPGFCKLEFWWCNCNIHTCWIIYIGNIYCWAFTIISNGSVNRYPSIHFWHTNRRIVKIVGRGRRLLAIN